LHHDYTTIGHVTVDLMADGIRRPGGGAFYSALQASRLGMSALVITQGVEEEIRGLLEPYRDELDLLVLPAPQTTTLHTTGAGGERVQRVLAWAGAMPDDILVDTGILHLAPVARETPGSWAGAAAFVGITPQGLARTWPGPGGRIELEPVGAGLAAGCDAVVLSAGERAACSALIERASLDGATVAVTAEAGANELIIAGGGNFTVEVPPLAEPRDDLGAGDVFAAAFFTALARGDGAREAAELGNAAAAVRISGRGSGAVGRLEQIESRLRSVARR
jgi:hypothetical protein